MAEETAISWCDHTFNAWIGCNEVSPECDNCYARILSERYGWAKWGADTPRHRTSADNWKKPKAWNRKAAADGVRRRVFCLSLGDVMDPTVPIEWRMELMQLIRDTPHLDWLLLTKLPKLMAEFFERHPIPPNVWAGATVGTQKMADLRIPWLLRVPAKVRFLSMEPLLERIDLTAIRTRSGSEVETRNALTGSWQVNDGDHHRSGKLQHKVDWVIAGGESGPKRRDLNLEDARGVRDQCAGAMVAFHFKQVGGLKPESGGRLLDGVLHDAFPEVVQ